jgi:uncharacterized BrkB/YihY/UPF0761 family membrane protein
MHVAVHRAVSAVLQIMLVAFVTLFARVQRGVLRSKHWFATAAAAVAVVALLGQFAFILGRPNAWMWG